jgi:hypothetical protein
MDHSNQEDRFIPNRSQSVNNNESLNFKLIKKKPPIPKTTRECITKAKLEYKAILAEVCNIDDGDSRLLKFSNKRKEKDYTKKHETNKKLSHSFSIKKTNLPLLKIKNDATRDILNRPFTILDAPGLIDDYYTNILDWSSRNDTIGSYCIDHKCQS